MGSSPSHCPQPDSSSTAPSCALHLRRRCRSEARVGSRHFAAAYLQVTREEVEEGLGLHSVCPQALKEWFKREGGLGSTAGQFI